MPVTIRKTFNAHNTRLVVRIVNLRIPKYLAILDDFLGYLGGFAYEAVIQILQGLGGVQKVRRCTRQVVVPPAEHVVDSDG